MFVRRLSASEEVREAFVEMFEEERYLEELDKEYQKEFGPFYEAWLDLLESPYDAHDCYDPYDYMRCVELLDEELYEEERYDAW